MKFSDLAAKLNNGVSGDQAESKQAITDIQDKYLFDISGAEAWLGGGVTGGSSSPPSFNAFGSWALSF